jgi:predicted ferric reductase
MLFHRKMGVAALLFALAHPWLLSGHAASAPGWFPTGGNAGTRAGAAALWALIAVVAVSLARRWVRIRYETWRRLHLGLALIVMGGMLWHALALGAYARTPPVNWLLVTYIAAFGALMLHYRVGRPWQVRRRPWEIAANRDEGGDTRTLVLRAVGHAGLEFEPGQFVWLTLGATPFHAEQHPISISSSANPRPTPHVELSIKALGDWSRETVPAARPGDRAWLDGPFGAFSVDRMAAEGFVMIAGGIGVTPMRAMLLSMRDRADPRHVVLFYAARNRSRAPFAAELEALAAEIDLRLVFVFEEPGEPGAVNGRVTTAVLRAYLPAHLRRLGFLVCGPGPMMDALERSLREIGVLPRQIRTERFDMV